MSDRRYIPLAELRERYGGASVDALERRFTARGVTLYDISGGGRYRKLAVEEADADALARPVRSKAVPTPVFHRNPSRADVLARLRS